MEAFTHHWDNIIPPASKSKYKVTCALSTPLGKPDMVLCIGHFYMVIKTYLHEFMNLTIKWDVHFFSFGRIDISVRVCLVEYACTTGNRVI